VDADCADIGVGAEAYVCACTESSLDCTTDAKSCKEASKAPGALCKSNPDLSCGKGQCVLAQCRDDVAAFQRQTCEAAPTKAVKEACEAALLPCASAGEQCKFLACVNDDLTNFTDNRLKMLGQ
jgi:5'-nucleotidase / UDP-sugar diphosphatase